MRDTQSFVVEGEHFGTSSLYLQGEVEPLFAVSFVVQTFLQPEGAALLLLVTDHVELLLLVSRHNTEGELGIFSSISILSNELQNLRTTEAEHHMDKVCQLHPLGGVGFIPFQCIS